MACDSRQLGIGRLIVVIGKLVRTTGYCQLGPYLRVWPLVDSWCGAVVGIDGIVMVEGGRRLRFAKGTTSILSPLTRRYSAVTR